MENKKAKDMNHEELENVFDNFYGMKNCGLKLEFEDWKEENRDIISDSLVNYYETYTCINPHIRDGKEMFEYWAYEFFRSKWVLTMQNDNLKEFPVEML
tara:strand:+ start:721 stop:1017 length:297 start_codon:yes stop_codon:yes gene_type:complete